MRGGQFGSGRRRSGEVETSKKLTAGFGNVDLLTAAGKSSLQQVPLPQVFSNVMKITFGCAIYHGLLPGGGRN